MRGKPPSHTGMRVENRISAAAHDLAEDAVSVQGM